jgi:hypothetical protein
VDCRDIPYREMTSDELGRAAASSWTVKSDAGGEQLEGPCPRCGAWLTKLLVGETFRHTLNTSTPNLLSKTEIEPMICRCLGAHPGRPPSEEGCGAYWAFELTEVE